MTNPAIPIRNLYYLLCYAWNKLDEGSLVDVSRLQSNELVDLFAHVLAGGMEHLLRRGVEQGYADVLEDIAGIRGRIEMLPTMRRFLQQHGRARCRYEELSVDTPANRIIKATIRALLRVPELSAELRVRLKAVERELRDVSVVRVDDNSFRLIQLHSNNRFYRFLLSICELVHGAWLVDQTTGHHRFRDFLRDEQKMAYVFQDFVLNFYRLERPDLAVRRERIRWRAVSEDDPTLALLPAMETDISIRRGDKNLVVDTKYYSNTLRRRFDSEKIHSANLYQLLAYLSNYERGPNERLEGMLLYPTVERNLNVQYVIQGLPVTVATLDLAAEWPQIRDQLMSLVPH